MLLDRLGKGLRTPARDALISFASVPSARATAFGVHRALDAVGRLAGPLMAFAVLKMAPKAFDAVFFVSICFALIGLATITLLVVDERSSTSGSGEESQVSSLPNARLAPTAIGPLAPAANSSLVSATIGIESRSKARFRWWVISATVLSAVAIGEAFFVLVLERRGAISADSVPLFFTGLGLAQIVLTLPCSRLADRIGRKRVWVGGQVVLLAAYAALLFGGGAANLVWIGVLLLGLHLAATDGVSSALTSLFVSTERRAVGLAIVAGAAGLAELGASIGFGAAWAWRGLDFGLGLFAACAAAGILVAILAPWSDLTASHVDCP